MPDVSEVAMAEAFGLTATGPAHPVRRRGQVEAWRLPTDSGPVLIKRFWAEDKLPWQDQLEAALELERRAVESGIDTPAPIRPARPLFGSVARIDGRGLFRAFPYLDHRPLADDDDIADWVGSTLARTHRLHRLDQRPAPNWWYCQFPPVPAEQWRRWLDDGEATGAVWAPALREQLELVLQQAEQVVSTFGSSPPYALSHRDVEPWNVLMTDDGPQLIDWDTSGPESIPLETAYVLITFARMGRAEPDVELVRRAYRSYLAAGGPALPATPGLLDRTIGMHLSTIAGSLGNFFDTRDHDEKIRDRIEQLPIIVRNARRWEHLLDGA